MTMEKLILTIIILGVSYGYAQTTNLTFQWHGQTMRVLETPLTPIE